MPTSGYFRCLSRHFLVRWSYNKACGWSDISSWEIRRHRGTGEEHCEIEGATAMKRRLLPMMMTLVLVCALPIWAAFVTSGDVTNPLVETAEATTPTLVDVSLPGELKQAIEAGSSVRLTADIDITETLVVTKSLTLDLNGFMLWLKSQNYGSECWCNTNVNRQR